jgi:hypothetical protein
LLYIFDDLCTEGAPAVLRIQPVRRPIPQKMAANNRLTCQFAVKIGTKRFFSGVSNRGSVSKNGT